MKKIIKYIKKPKLILLLLANKGFLNFVPDKQFLKLKYRIIIGKKLNLDHPVTFNEKLQWLKLHDRKEIYKLMVDKYEAKKYVAKIIGDEYIIPTIGVYDKFSQIDFDILPNQFVIKCTHDSGGLIIVKNKEKMNINEVRKKINKFLKRKFYYVHREWPYKNFKPRIIIEKYMEDEKNKIMRDYKFFCFNGNPQIMYISEGLENHKTARMSFFDMNYKVSGCKRKDFKQFQTIPMKPVNFEKMKKFASILSKGIAHLRVDFYEINGRLYFGELTFFTGSGYIPFEDEKWDKKLGNMIDLSLVNQYEK